MATSNKIVFKGWNEAVGKLQDVCETLISGTPTSTTRNILTEINILIYKAKEEKRKEFDPS